MTGVLIGVPCEIVPIHDVTEIFAGDAFALPARTVVLAWQIVLDAAVTSMTGLLQGSIDGTNWTTLDTSTSTTGGVRTVTAPTACMFVRFNLTAVAENTALFITVTLVAKVAIP